MRQKPTVALLATGGTIAGVADSTTATTPYRAAALDTAALLAAVPELDTLADIRAEQLLQLDSKDMQPAHWLQIAHRAQALADDPVVDGIVLTHGTDTLEETAWFLHLVLKTDKPVVMTAAMRPATALSADGPMNLFGAVAVAASPDFSGLGVVVAMNDRVFGARDLTKRHTLAVDAFGTEDGAIGWTHPPVLRRRPAGVDCAVAGLDTLTDGHWPPWVEILHVAAGSSPRLLDAARGLGVDGVVLALPGNGSVPSNWREPIAACIKAGIAVVRASRVGAGGVSRAAMPSSLLDAGWLPPVKARVALMLALALGEPALFERLAYST